MELGLDVQKGEGGKEREASNSRRGVEWQLEGEGVQTSREGKQAASKGGRGIEVAPEGVYVQAPLIVDGSVPVRDTQHSAPAHMQHLSSPGPHIAKPLRMHPSLPLLPISLQARPS